MEHGIAAIGTGVTREFSHFLAGLSLEDISSRALHESRRAVLDWLGCALAGSAHPTVAVLIDGLREVGGRPDHLVIGHDEPMGLLEAPLANGLMGHVLDYDDTHLSGAGSSVIIHMSSPVLPALFALAERSAVRGSALALALIAGFEAGVRIGEASPGHHARGWHLTGTLGALAAAVAAARLLGMGSPQIAHALGIAATQAAGLQQNRGTSCKSFHAGKAASNGLLSALLARRGFDSSAEILEGRKGFGHMYAERLDGDALLRDLGREWRIERNGLKPYACGVVMHPAIDAMIGLAGRGGIDPRTVCRIELRVHPHAIAITGVADPRSGLQSKFSLLHAVTAAFVDKAAGIAQFSDERADASDLRALRPKVAVTVDESLRKEEAWARITDAGGRHEIHVARALGTAANPMDDSAVEGKFMANAAPVVGRARAEMIRDLAWRFDGLDDAARLLALCAKTAPSAG